MRTSYLVIFLLIPIFSFAQSFNINQGSVKKPGYFTKIEYQNVKEKLIVNAQIRKKTYRFILDTGAPTMISKAVFEELGLTVIQSLPIRDANGRPDSLMVANLSEISLGGVEFNDVPALVSRDQMIFDCFKVDGFIGSNLLRNSILSISSKDHQITLTDQIELLKPNKKQSADLVLNKAQRSPYINIKIKKSKSASAMVLFDSGMEGLYDVALKHYELLAKENIFTVLAKSNGSSTISLNGVGSDTLQYRLLLPELNINGTLLKNVISHTTASENSRVGAQLLQYGIVTLDYLNKKFYFEAFENDVDVFKALYPLAVTIKDNKLVAGIIWDPKLMDKIKTNDQILKVDGKDVSKINTCEFITGNSIFEGRDKVILTIKNSQGEIEQLEVKRSNFQDIKAQ